MRDTDLAYLAGIVDADGYITIQRSQKPGRTYYGAIIGISGTRREPHDLAASLFGGKVHSYVNRTEDNRLMFSWERYGEKALPVIGALQPYLRLKVEQARLAFELHEHLVEEPALWPADLRAAMEDLADDIRGLNLGRRRR